MIESISIQTGTATSKVAEAVAHEICYFSKEIRGPVFYRYYKNQFFTKLWVFEFLTGFLDKVQHFS